MGFKMRTLTLLKPRTEQDLLIIHDSPVNRFSWTELKEATCNFSSKNVVGRGGFGKVYRGQLPDGSVVAIKRSKERTPERDLQFQAEVEIGGNQVLSRHKNVLGLLGYCMTRSERLLVYPFLVNGSVDSMLRESSPSRPALDWIGRKQIALGVANGLAHLHSGSCFAVIHRDVKAANILLNDEFEAVLCDFGLAKVVAGSSNPIPSASGWLQRTVEEEEEEEDSADEETGPDRLCIPGMNPPCFDFTKNFNDCTWSCWLFTTKIEDEDEEEERAPIGHQQSANSELQTNNIEVVTTVRGTKGHIAPEYHATSKCSIKNDVFAYGIMILELITGQKAFDKARQGNGMLLDWVNRLVGDDKLDLVFDPNIKGNCIQEEMEELLKLALLCTTTCPADRPEMSKITEMLENIGIVQTISLHRLKLATDNFSDKNTIGRSGFSNLYRGRLREDGSVVLVKRLAKTGTAYMLQLQGEVKLGGMSGHKNVLNLIGYCFTWSESLLMYPFTDSRSLEWHLGPEGHLPPDLQLRMSIALGVAKGLDYMHRDCGATHGNLKPSNILLEEGSNPVLCNFRIPVTFDVLNSDVYRYGVTLMALISGRNVAQVNANNAGLHDWLKDRLRHRELNLVVDSQIITPGDWNYTIDIKNEIEQLFQVSLLCTQPSPTDRPQMWEVIQMLDGILKGDLKVCFEYDRANLFRFDKSPQLIEFEPRHIIDPPDRWKDIIISGRWKNFVSEVVSDGLPTRAKLFRKGMSVDPICLLCEEYEEDNFHLFFKCDVSKQAWQIAVGVRIDMLGFGSAKEAVDVIMKPDDILPAGVEPGHFSRKGVAVMYSIWTHRNKVCFENVSPNVMDIVSWCDHHVSEHLVTLYDDDDDDGFGGKGQEAQHEMEQEMCRNYVVDATYSAFDCYYESDLTEDVLSGPR